MTGIPVVSITGERALASAVDSLKVKQHVDAPSQDPFPEAGACVAPLADAPCKIVPRGFPNSMHSSQCSQEFQPLAERAHQCADPNPYQDKGSHSSQVPEEKNGQAGSSQRAQSVAFIGRNHHPTFSPAPDETLNFANTNSYGSKSSRKARRKAADISRIIGKPWRDLDRAEKVCMAMASMERQGGSTISLNFGISRQRSCQKLRDPRRIFEKELNRQLNLVGLVGMNLVMTLEVTPHGSRTQSRVHAHGAVATSGLSKEQIMAFQVALRKAASVAVGAIGGDRQLVMKPITSARGWMDYCIEDQARTRKTLGIDDLWVMTREAQRAAKAFHGELNRARQKNAA